VAVKVYVRTFGCRANHYDSETVRAMIEAAGHLVVARAADADVAIFNSCAVTADAEADLRQSVRRAAREQPTIRSVIMGCASALPEVPGVRSLRALPTVERLVSGAAFHEVADALGLPPTGAVVRAVQQSTARAVLRIQDGCDEHCTFCATTLARGANRSRALGDLLAEAARLAEQHPEIVLTGIHIGTYGRDIDSSLGELVEALVQALPSIRFRLSSLEATEVDDRLFELLTGEPAHLVPYLHAPLQSGSNSLLRRMGRHWYTAESYGHMIERIAARCSVFGLGCDLITGFPGETESDHAATLALVERLPFTSLHVFPFSLRPGTPAERLPSQVPVADAERRARELRTMGDAKSAAYRRSRDGGDADIVVVRGGGPRANGAEGLTEDYLTVRLQDQRLARGQRRSGRLRIIDGILVAETAEHESLLANPLGSSI
jgi:threonylcarbamoyladenosine tRNA methylthiotransferase MtaB